RAVRVSFQAKVSLADNGVGVAAGAEEVESVLERLVAGGDLQRVAGDFAPGGRGEAGLVARAPHIETDVGAAQRGGVDRDTAGTAGFLPGEDTGDEGLFVTAVVDIADVLDPSIEWSDDRQVLHSRRLETVAVVVKDWSTDEMAGIHGMGGKRQVEF